MRGEIKTFTEIREKVNLQFITNIQLRLNSLIFYSNLKINSVLNTKEGFEKETKTINIFGWHQILLFVLQNYIKEYLELMV